MHHLKSLKAHVILNSMLALLTVILVACSIFKQVYKKKKIIKNKTHLKVETIFDGTNIASYVARLLFLSSKSHAIDSMQIMWHSLYKEP
jgi:hypothetical protein